MTDTTPLWEVARSAILDHINGIGDIDKFTSWAVITATMFVGNADYIPQELEFIRSKKPAWLPALNGPLEFDQVPSDLYPGTSGNAIHQLYHLTRWAIFNRISPKMFDSIVEIGAGYGEMARVIHALGFNGTYYIYDLPEVHQLQRIYLGRSLPVDSRVVYLDKPEQIPQQCDLLIGCFSLSEMPVSLRNRIMQAIDSDSYLIVYQPEFYGINNDAWVGSVAEKMAAYYVFMDKNPDSRTDWRYFIANRR